MKFCKRFISWIYFFVLILLLASCNKVDVTFGSTVSPADPNITYLDNYETDIATNKIDSFITSGHQFFSAGYHYDSLFGVVSAGSYAQVNLPAVNPLINVTDNIIFDSLQLLIKPSGSFYGDSTLPMKINVYRLSQNIATPDSRNYYFNTSSFSYYPSPIGQQTVNLNGISGGSTPISIRLSDALGQELLDKFKNNDNDIITQENFINYFKGIYINTDSAITRSVAYFNNNKDSLILRLNYHQNGVSSQAKNIDFNYDVTNQFSNIKVRYTNPQFAAFINNKAQLIPSTLTGNQSFLNTSFGSSIKITFPSLLNLKELHPFISVVKATLVIKPDPKSYSYPYQLPNILHLFNTDDTNYPLAEIYYNNSQSSPQTGNLFTDYLYNENTNYSYDITNFINTKIAEGQASTSGLLLYTTLDNYDMGIQRLIINDQQKNKAIQLQLYVLGL